MSKTTTAKPKASPSPASQSQLQSPPSLPSLMAPGTGADSEDSLFIVLYGAPKVEKTTACSTIPNAKWIVSDPNAKPTLRALGRMPRKENFYPCKSLVEAREILGKAIDIAQTNGPKALGCTAVVVDSLTQFFDWHQEDVAKATGQSFLGQNKKENGWNQFNVEFGRLIDDLAVLSQYIPVIALAHAASKMDFSKGAWSGLSLSPKSAEKVGRMASWVLFQTKKSFDVEEDVKPSDFVRVETMPSGARRATELIIHTQQVEMWTVACSSMRDEDSRPRLNAEEPADMYRLLIKEGILQ